MSTITIFGLLHLTGSPLTCESDDLDQTREVNKTSFIDLCSLAYRSRNLTERHPKAALAASPSTAHEPTSALTLSCNYATSGTSRAKTYHRVSTLASTGLHMPGNIAQHQTIRSQSEPAHKANSHFQQRRHFHSRLLLNPRSRACLSQPRPPTKSSQSQTKALQLRQLRPPNREPRPTADNVCTTISWRRSGGASAVRALEHQGDRQQQRGLLQDQAHDSAQETHGCLL